MRESGGGARSEKDELNGLFWGKHAEIDRAHGHSGVECGDMCEGRVVEGDSVKTQTRDPFLKERKGEPSARARRNAKSQGASQGCGNADEVISTCIRENPKAYLSKL